MWNGNSSYPYQVASYYSSSTSGIQVVDMAVSGETTTSMLDGGQMSRAVSFLEQHANVTVLITIDIGGNDLLPCVSGLSVNLSCIQQAETTAVSNLTMILTGLRQAAGPSVPIYGMNYYDPFLGDWLAGGSSQDEADLSVSLVGQLNSLLTGAYQSIDAPVADVASAFDTTDLTDQVSSQWGEVPVAVDKACTLLDITCNAGQTEGFGDDPNDAGATVIARTFEQTIGETISQVSTSTTIGSSTTTTSSMTVGGGSGTTSTTSATRTASSGSLAFTGAGHGTRFALLAGLVLTVGGSLVLVLDSMRRRASRRPMPPP